MGDRLMVKGHVPGEPTVRISRRSCGPVGIADAVGAHGERIHVSAFPPYGVAGERVRALAAARADAVRRLAAAH